MSLFSAAMKLVSKHSQSVLLALTLFPSLFTNQYTEVTESRSQNKSRDIWARPLNKAELKKIKAAAGLFEGAAKQGHLESQLNMGFLFSHGRGVDQSYEKAVYW